MTSTIIRRGTVGAETRDESLGQAQRRKLRAADFDLGFHSTWTRTFFGFGRRVCMCCGKRWKQNKAQDREGCPTRLAAIEQYVALASKAELWEMVQRGLLTREEAGIRVSADRPAEPPHYSDPFGLMGVTAS